MVHEIVERSIGSLGMTIDHAASITVKFYEVGFE
jgi:hypothetical protein